MIVFSEASIETGQIQKRTTADAAANNGDVKYSYDGESRLTEADSTNGTVPDYRYEYDKVGNVTKESKDSTSTWFGYDYAGQLCWQDSTAHNTSGDDHVLDASCQNVSGATNYDHDDAGNNTGTATGPRSYNANSQVTQIGGVDMAYADLGNPIRTQAGITSFVNSPLGFTARKTGTQITYYTRDPNGQILSSHGAGGTVNYVSEYNGTVAALYSPAGVEVGYYRYSPYGQTTVVNNGSSTTADSNPFRYVGGYQDKTSTGDDGFYKLGARYYDGRGHFTQPDAIAGTINDPKTLTSYNYAGGDPINASDPSGMSLGDLLGKSLAVFDGVSAAAGYLGAESGEEALGIVGGYLAGGAVGAGCTALIGESLVGVGFCAGVGAYVGDGVKNTIISGNPQGVEGL